MPRRVIKVSPKTMKMFKNARGINDPRRVSKVYEKATSISFFVDMFLDKDDDGDPDFENDYIWKNKINELFGDDYEDEIVYLEYYWIEEECGYMSRLMWKCNQYDNMWREVYYNSSSRFAAGMCNFDDDDYTSCEE